MVWHLNIIMMIARRTASVNEGVISAAVNCSHMRPVNPTLLTLVTLRCLQLIFFIFIMRRVCKHLSTTGDTIFPRPIKI